MRVWQLLLKFWPLQFPLCNGLNILSLQIHMLKSYPLNAMVLWGVAIRRWFRLDDIMRMERPRWDQYRCKSPWGLPQWLSGKESACTARDTGDLGLIPGSERSLGQGHGKPLHYSCLENPMDRGAWRATVHGVAQNRTWWKQLSTHACTSHQRACFLALLSTACRFSK